MAQALASPARNSNGSATAGSPSSYSASPTPRPQFHHPREQKIDPSQLSFLRPNPAAAASPRSPSPAILAPRIHEESATPPQSSHSSTAANANGSANGGSNGAGGGGGGGGGSGQYPAAPAAAFKKRKEELLRKRYGKQDGPIQIPGVNAPANAADAALAAAASRQPPGRPLPVPTQVQMYGRQNNGSVAQSHASPSPSASPAQTPISTQSQLQPQNIANAFASAVQNHSEPPKLHAASPVASPLSTPSVLSPLGGRISQANAASSNGVPAAHTAIGPPGGAAVGMISPTNSSASSNSNGTQNQMSPASGALYKKSVTPHEVSPRLPTSPAMAPVGGHGHPPKMSNDHSREKEKASNSSTLPSPLSPNEDSRIGEYQLMEPIGKGGFGTVYRGINIVSGRTVAIKRVNLTGIPAEELEPIENEIKLLQNLSHPNIVKYLDSVRTAEHLNIIMDYAENGALSSLLSKMGGKFPESLVAHYTAQVLKGLNYLHLQGVIHRDIKGANILSTKDGVVKLADFGVATKLNESMRHNSVVGTPYWMAPEIIEMTGQQSSACDIWSVACTMIELLTGKPPYFDLAQMPALFRIVQDDHPPLPESISPALEDFLLQCFQKDPNRRIDAKGLLKHPWLKKLDSGQENQSGNRNGDKAPAMASVVQIAMSKAKKNPGGGANSRKPLPTPSSRKPPKFADGEDWDDLEASMDNEKESSGGVDSEEEDWDKELEEESNPKEKPKKIVEAAGKTKQQQGTLRSGHVTPLGAAALAKSNANNVKSSVHLHDPKFKLRKELEGDEDPFEGIDEEDDHDIISPKGDVKSPLNLPKLKSHDSSSAAAAPGSSSKDKDAGKAGKLQHALSGPSKKLNEFVEAEDDEKDEYADLDDSLLSAADEKSVKKLTLQPKALNDIHVPAELFADNDNDDPFNDLAFEDDRHDENAAYTRTFLRVLSQLNPQNEERVLMEATEKLNELYSKNQELLRSLISSYGVIPIMEMLEVSHFSILHSVLKFINKLIQSKNAKFQQSLSLIGLIPAIIHFGSRNYPLEIRMEAASFVRSLCYVAEFTRKMFIACNGMKVLVSFLEQEEESYEKNKTLLWNAIDCICHVFDISTNPKNDFCRLFCKYGLLEPLTRALKKLLRDNENRDAAIEYVRKTAKILHLFSQGDQIVKNHFAKPTVIENMLLTLPQLPQDVLLLILKSIRGISMDPTTLDLLERAGAIPALIPFLNSPYMENQQQVLLTMYYLCQIKPSRQEEAALSGIIPHLQRFVRTDHPLKQFAFPILFGLAKSSTKARIELKKYAGIQFYLDVLRDLYWRTHALEVLAAWLQEDPVRVGFILNTTSNINKLLTCFQSTTNITQFEKMLPLYRKILSVSIRVNQSFGKSPLFIHELKSRLDRHSSSNNIRVNLLKVLALIIVAHSNAKQLIEEHQLLPMLQKLCEDKASVIVVSLASKLIEKIRNPEANIPVAFMDAKEHPQKFVAIANLA